MPREESQWLIKSSGRILGPFPSGKVADLLNSREISVLDEVSSPSRRWQTIQYHEDFKGIVENLRKTALSEKTEANWTNSGNLTETLTDILDSDLTDEVTMSGFSATPKEIVIHNVVEHGQQVGNSAAGGRFQPQVAHNASIQRQAEKTTRGMWLVTAAVLLAVAVFIFLKRGEHFGGDTKNSYAVLKQKVMADVQSGQYADALRELKAFYPDPAQAGEMAIYYGELLLQVDGQTVVGRRLLQSVLAGHRADTKLAYTGLGIADLIDGQADSAQENFDKALGQDANYLPAVINSAAVALQKSDYERAKIIATSALQLNPSQAEALLILAQAQLYLFKKNHDLSELNKIHLLLKEYVLHQWDYAAEVGFYNLYFDFLRQDKNFDERLRRYLDTDPRLTQDHRHNVFIYKGNIQWKTLGRMCEQLADRVGESARVSALSASCFGREGRWEQARTSIERASQQAPHDALVQAWHSYVLRESGEPEQASVVLARASELNRAGEFALPTLLQARFCASVNDVDCARESWQRIYSRDMDYLPAVSGLALVNAAKGFHGEAVKLTEKGLKISPDYIPLLQLRQKGEKEGWYAVSN